MYYLSENLKWIETDSADLIAIHNCLQELQLWKGENPLKAELGIDYWAVFESRVFLEQEVVRVLERHEQNFSSISIVDCSQTPEIAEVVLDFFLSDDSKVRAEIRKNNKDLL